MTFLVGRCKKLDVTITKVYNIPTWDHGSHQFDMGKLARKDPILFITFVKGAKES